MKFTFAITSDLLEEAYRNGMVPYGQYGRIVVWDEPDPRAIFELDRFRYGRSIRQIYSQHRFDIRYDTAIPDVLHHCAGPRRHEAGTWITPAMHKAYLGMAERGVLHTVEAWQGGRLAGGLFVVTLGAACCGESMFHLVPNASNVCLIALVENLRRRGYAFLDIQYVTDHLARFDPVLISRASYLRRLKEAQTVPLTFLEEERP